MELKRVDMMCFPDPRKYSVKVVKAKKAIAKAKREVMEKAMVAYNTFVDFMVEKAWAVIVSIC